MYIFIKSHCMCIYVYIYWSHCMYICIISIYITSTHTHTHSNFWLEWLKWIFMFISILSLNASKVTVKTSFKKYKTQGNDKGLEVVDKGLNGYWFSRNRKLKPNCPQR